VIRVFQSPVGRKSSNISMGSSMGPSIKYVTLDWGRGSEKVWQFMTGGGGKEHVTSHLSIFLSYIWNMKF